MKFVIYPIGPSWYWKITSGTARIAESSKPFHTADLAVASARRTIKRLQSCLPVIEVEAEEVMS